MRPRADTEDQRKPGTVRSSALVDERLFVKALDRGLRVLAAFSQQPRPLGLSEIARRTGIGKSAAQRLLHTLLVLGYIKQEHDTRRYVLSPKALEIGNSYLRMDNVLNCAKPYLIQAGRACDETVNLTELIDADVVYVARIPSRQMISVDILLGARLPAYCTAPGRAMLAFLPPRERANVLKQSNLAAITRYTITDINRLNEILNSVRTQGYAMTDQESFLGDISVAAPVFNSHRYPVAAVNVAVSATRWTAIEVEMALAPIVCEAAKATSEAISAAGL